MLKSTELARLLATVRCYGMEEPTVAPEAGINPAGLGFR